jgi:hypothetical protein
MCRHVSWCARRESNPQQTTTQAALSTSVGVRARGAAARCRPGPSAVRKRSRSRARRRRCRARRRCPPLIRTTISASRVRRPAVERMGIVLARAPPRDRTGCPSIKSRVLHRYSSRRVRCRLSRSRPVFAVPFARFAQCQAARSGTSHGNSAAWLMITEYLQLIWCGISMKSKSP